MDIGGFTKNSFIDYKDTCACVVFLNGCNFNCPYCHNPHLVNPLGGSVLEDDYIFRFLKKRKKFLKGVVISGGEPTLQPKLLKFCKTIKDIGYKIKLDTNGSRPDILENLLNENLIDYIAMDIKTSFKYYHSFSYKNKTKDIQKSIDIIREKMSEYEFRTTCTRYFIDKETIKDIGKLIMGSKKYVLQQCVKRDNFLDNDFLFDENSYFKDNDIKKFKDLVSPFVKTVELRNLQEC